MFNKENWIKAYAFFGIDASKWNWGQLHFGENYAGLICMVLFVVITYILIFNS